VEETVQSRALKRAAQMLGGKAQLREHLKCSARDLDTWLAGAQKPPMDVFLKAVDIVSAASPVLSKPAERARQLRHKADAAIARAAATRERSLAIYQAIVERRLEFKPAPRPASALAFLQAKFEPRDGPLMVSAALDAAVAATGADMGNVQLACPEGLRIVAQRGFRQPFLEFFALVAEPHCACGAALGAAQRVAIADVRSDTLFAGTQAEQVMLEAGALAVQSTPLVGPNGVLGMISTHYTAPHYLTERGSDVLDHIARRAAFWLDGGAI
jgi:GAF domain-containing protein